MNISFDTRVSIPLDVLVSELSGELVILNLDNESYYGLDEVGTHMWTALTTSETIQSAYDGLLAEYEVGEERLRQDLTDLLGKLITQGLVEVAVE
jgi:hypothetical protein